MITKMLCYLILSLRTLITAALSEQLFTFLRSLAYGDWWQSVTVSVCRKSSTTVSSTLAAGWWSTFNYSTVLQLLRQAETLIPQEFMNICSGSPDIPTMCSVTSLSLGLSRPKISELIIFIVQHLANFGSASHIRRPGQRPDNHLHFPNLK